MTAEALGSEEEIKRRDDKDKGEKAEEDKIPLAREGAVSIHAPPDCPKTNYFQWVRTSKHSFLCHMKTGVSARIFGPCGPENGRQPDLNFSSRGRIFR